MGEQEVVTSQDIELCHFSPGRGEREVRIISHFIQLILVTVKGYQLKRGRED